MPELQLKPIGVIHSPFSKPGQPPRQAYLGKETEAKVEIYPEFSDGLQDLGGFSHLYLIWQFHQSKDYQLLTYPHGRKELTGVFATRSPHRPNPLALSLVELAKIEQNILTIRGVDMIEGTPLLDIKPYIPRLDYREEVKLGWIAKRKDIK